MSDRTKIEWTRSDDGTPGATWNPVTGCTKLSPASPGCQNCYASTFAERFRGAPGHYFERGFDVQLRPDKLALPLRWTKPRKVFVNSMSDLFHDKVPDEYIAEVFAVMACAYQHTFQLLTKRHGRMRSLLSSDEFISMVDRESIAYDRSPLGHRQISWPLRNVWLGVSAEDQKRADLRIPALLDTPAAVRFVSGEPLLGPIELKEHWLHPVMREPSPENHALGRRIGKANGVGFIDWVIVGGESGPGARVMVPDYAREIRDQCVTAGVPFLFKQWGEWAPINDRDTMQRVGKKRAGRELDGRTWDQYPEAVA